MEKLTLKVEEVLKLIPKCGGKEVYQFINACDMIIVAVDEKHLPILIKYITTWLSGKTVEVIDYRDTTI